MHRLFPKKFGLRQWLLTSLAIGMAGIFAYLTVNAGFGAIGVMMIFTLLGTVVFIALSGSNRLFFTALFTASFTTFVVAGLFIEDYFLYPVVGENVPQQFCLQAYFVTQYLLPYRQPLFGSRQK